MRWHAGGNAVRMHRRNCRAQTPPSVPGKPTLAFLKVELEERESQTAPSRMLDASASEGARLGAIRTENKRGSDHACLGLSVPSRSRSSVVFAPRLISVFGGTIGGVPST